MLHSNRYALSVLSYFVWAFLLIVLGSYLRRELGLQTLVNALAWGLLAASVINIGIVVLQFVGRTGGAIHFLPSLSSYGALSQPNHFANFCALAIASLIYLYAKGRFSPSLFSLLLVLMMFMLSFSGSRSAWLYLTAMTILIAMMYSSTAKQGTVTDRIRHIWRAGLLLIPLFILVQFFIFFVIPNALVNLPTERLVDGVTAYTPSARLQFWYDSLRIFLQSPWLGVGAGQLFSHSFLLLDVPSAMDSKRAFEHAHNLFLHVLAEMGIGGFLIVAAGLFTWARAFKWSDFNIEKWWLISLLSVIGIHSMLEYPLWLSFFLGIAAILFGAGSENFITIGISARANKFARSGLTALWLLGLVNISTLLIANIKLDNWFQKMAYENVSDLAQLSWAKRYSLLSPNADLMQAMSMDIRSMPIDEAITVNQSAMQFNPVRRVIFQQALLLALQGKNTLAVKQMNRALIAFPNGLEAVLKNTPPEYKKIYLDLQLETQSNIGK
ncbi:MAG: hypothetical protein CTY10_09615 [Methylotenera sp.]|nr:MAG: hypothetical protein CTY10_09615 [Methylotenera sp.]